jgi:BASS family bile acid:Na+ symporter
MADLDAVRINFDAENLRWLNLCLGFIMFGVALDLQVQQFRALFRQPRSLILGLLSQMIGLPLLTVGLVLLLQPPPGLGLGMLLVAICPGGNVSNYATHLSGANTPLSVSMTTISTLAAVISTPLLFSVLAPLLPGSQALRAMVQVDAWAMVGAILQVILIPLALGFLFQHLLPRLTARLLKPVKRLSMAIFLGFVAVVIAGNLAHIGRYVPYIFFYVFIHNLLALGMGYFWARLNHLPEADARAISLETGIQNSGLALALVFNFFDGLGGMALIAAWWGVWHLVSAFGLAAYWKRRG